jgi:DNA-directed RNA polymerase subunit RPC12/RpoP
MAVSDMVNLSGLLDEAKCFELMRQHRWPDGVRCPDCDSAMVIRNGHDDSQRHRQRYLCKACHGRFDDLSGTVRNCSPPPGSIEIIFIKGLSIQAGSEPILSILKRLAWGGIRGHVLK